MGEGRPPCVVDGHGPTEPDGGQLGLQRWTWLTLGLVLATSLLQHESTTTTTTPPHWATLPHFLQSAAEPPGAVPKVRTQVEQHFEKHNNALLVCELLPMDGSAGTETRWAERSRGFILPKTWDPKAVPSDNMLGVSLGAPDGGTDTTDATDAIEATDAKDTADAMDAIEAVGSEGVVDATHVAGAIDIVGGSSPCTEARQRASTMTAPIWTHAESLRTP